MINISIFSENLSENFPCFSSAFKELDDEWYPDKPPPTMLMAGLGRFLAEEAYQKLTIDEVKNILLGIENLLETGSETEKDAVATGFLEAMLTVLDQNQEQDWILELVGPLSGQYIESWNHFCGIEKGGPGTR